LSALLPALPPGCRFGQLEGAGSNRGDGRAPGTSHGISTAPTAVPSGRATVFMVGPARCGCTLLLFITSFFKKKKKKQPKTSNGLFSLCLSSARCCCCCSGRGCWWWGSFPPWQWLRSFCFQPGFSSCEGQRLPVIAVLRAGRGRRPRAGRGRGLPAPRGWAGPGRGAVPLLGAALCPFRSGEAAASVDSPGTEASVLPLAVLAGSLPTLVVPVLALPPRVTLPTPSPGWSWPWPAPRRGRCGLRRLPRLDANSLAGPGCPQSCPRPPPLAAIAHPPGRALCQEGTLRQRRGCRGRRRRSGDARCSSLRCSVARPRPRPAAPQQRAGGGLVTGLVQKKK